MTYEFVILFECGGISINQNSEPTNTTAESETDWRITWRITWKGKEGMGDKIRRVKHYIPYKT